MPYNRTIFQALYNLGAHKFCIYGLAPPGCLPLPKMLYGQPKLDGYIDELNQEALTYNTKLMAAIGSLRARFSDIKVVYIDIYKSFMDIVKNPTKYGTSYNEKSFIDSL